MWATASTRNYFASHVTEPFCLACCTSVDVYIAPHYTIQARVRDPGTRLQRRQSHLFRVVAAPPNCLASPALTVYLARKSLSRVASLVLYCPHLLGIIVIAGAGS